MSNRLLKMIAVVFTLALFATSCGSDSVVDDAVDAATDAAGDAVDAVDEAVTGDEDAMDDDAVDGALPLEGDVEVAAGTVLSLGNCPDDWDAMQGITDDEIRVGQSLPQSGTLAAFGAIGDGMQMYFDFVNETDPVDGKNLTLVARDDAYEAGRAAANVEEMLETENIFAFVHMIGTPINVTVRPITDEACVPQLFNSSGFPWWGDPANWPWTVGNILNYVTETEIWCGAIVDEFGEGATVAALYMNNDFGTTYQDTMNSSDACSGIEVVEEQLHDPAAPDITNEMTTLIASGADVFLGGTTSAFCPQLTGAIAASEWRPRIYASYTCNNLSSFFEPVKDAAGALGNDGVGVRMTNSNKVCGDPQYADDPAIIEIEEILAEYGGVTCADGSFSTGVLYAQFVVDVLRDAAAMPGGLNRVNLMSAVWNADTSNPVLFGDSLKLDGVNDAYWTEAAQIQEIVVVDGSLTFNPVGEVIDLEGQGGSFGS